MSKPLRVAVIGGGCAAMTAALELTRPELEGRYAVTVYQQGWRLGGKGASGRGPYGRIEEHGLHIWMGFYENAFRMMRDVYGELGRDPRACPLATWKDAFVPFGHIGLADLGGESEWSVWSAAFPPLPGEPGDPLPPGAGNPFSAMGYLVRSAEVMGTLFRVAYGPQLPERAPMWRPRSETLDDLVEIAREVLRTAVGGAAAVLEIVERQLGVVAGLTRGLRGAGSAVGQVLGVVERVVEATQASLRQLEPPGSGEQVHRVRASEVLEVVVAGLLGALRAGVFVSPRGFDILDEHDFSDWLRLNGASEAAGRCPFVRGLYSLMFAFEDGDPTRPRAAAGQALRGCMRMFFTYRGSIFYKMTAGMGDVVFAPIHELLRRRGVRLEYFHKLTSVRFGEGHVAALDFDVQARVRGGAYDPLVLVRGVPSWPADPDWSQLEDGERLFREDRRFESFWDTRAEARRTLRVRDDFDFVVLGVGLGAIPHVCAELVARDARWRRMVEASKTVATQALQLWMKPDVRSLGWHRGPIAMTGFVSPFDTWADMTHLLPREAWPSESAPGSLAYFCNVLPDAELAALEPAREGFEARAREHVARNAERFVRRDLGALWPESLDRERQFRFEALVDWGEVSRTRPAPSGPPRLASQFTSTNVNPSDRYSLTLPGTPALRISPLDPTYDNFTACGDWTSCGLNLGCVEAAVMSGRLAAHAISQRPSLSAIIGYDHP